MKATLGIAGLLAISLLAVGFYSQSEDSDNAFPDIESETEIVRSQIGTECGDDSLGLSAITADAEAVELGARSAGLQSIEIQVAQPEVKASLANLMELYRQGSPDELDVFGQSRQSILISRFASAYRDEFLAWTETQFRNTELNDPQVATNQDLVAQFLSDTLGRAKSQEFQIECATSVCRLVYPKDMFLEIRKVERLEDKLDRGVFIDVPLVGTSPIDNSLMQSFVVRRDAPVFED